MPLDSLELVAVLPVAPERIYEAWLDAQEHTAFTGSKATVNPVVGGGHTAWDGYISGKNLELDPNRRIVQSWRSTEFPDNHPDSRLEVVFEPHAQGTQITLRHSEIPVGQGSQYEEGWKDYYLEKLAEYFADGEGAVTPLDVVESALDEAVEEVLEQTLQSVVVGKALAQPGPPRKAAARKDAKPAKKTAKPAKKTAKPAKKDAKPAKKVAKPAKRAAKPAKKAAKPAKKAAKPAKKAAKSAKKAARKSGAARSKSKR